MGDEGRTPYAASVHWPEPEADRAGSFDLTDAEDPARFPLSDADEEARQARLSAPPTPKPEVSAEERGRLVAACLDAVGAWRGVYGAGDLLVRRLAEEAGISVGEAEILVAKEVTRRGRNG